MAATDPSELNLGDFDEATGRYPYHRHTLRPEEHRLIRRQARFYWFYELVDRIRMLLKK